MARISGATVLLVLVATVSVYTWAKLAEDAALGRTARTLALDCSPAMTKQPEARDIVLRISVGLRGLAEDFAKELWSGNHRQGRSGGGACPGPVYTGKLFTQAELQDYQRRQMLARTAAARREISRSDDVYEGGAAAATAMPVSSYTEPWGGYHKEEERPSGGAHASVGDRAAAALPSSTARTSLPLSPAELQYHKRQAMLAQRAYTRREISKSDGVDKGAAAATVTPVSRHNTFSRDTELWGGHQSEGRSAASAGDGAALRAASLSAADRQRVMRSQIERIISNFSGEITDGARRGGAGAVGVVKVGPWGGSGGQAFYMPGGGSVPRLHSITLYHSDAVHAFSFESLLSGFGVSRTMAPSGGRSHGSKGLRATITLSWDDEHLTAVEGTFGHCRSVPEVVVTSLTFRTNKGRTYGPYGEETGTPFSIPAANGCIVGFWGRSGWLLDAVGVYIMPCQVKDAYKATS